MKGTPAWTRAVTGPLVVYVPFNFIFTLLRLGGGSPAIRGGQYVLLNHGKLIRTLTESQYHLYNAYVIRLFSGHWMMFYFVGMMLLYTRAGDSSRTVIKE